MKTIARLKEKKGFTLIELIIVIAILGIILLIGVPRFTDVLKTAQINADRATAANIGKAVRLWNIDNLPSNRPVPTTATIFTSLTDLDDYISFETKKPSSYMSGSEGGAYFVMANGTGKIAVAIGPDDGTAGADAIVTTDTTWAAVSAAFPANQAAVIYGRPDVTTGWAYLEQ